MSEQSSRWYLFHAWGKGTCRKQYLRWQRVVRNHGDCLGALSQRERAGSELAVRFGLRFQIKTVARQEKRFCRKQTGRSTHQADHSRSIGWPTRKIRRIGMQNKRVKLPDSPRPPSQASARPSFKVMHTRKLGRDVGLAVSGFRPTFMGLAGASRTFSLAFMRSARLQSSAASPALT